jgi:hypothetical protein
MRKLIAFLLLLVSCLPVFGALAPRYRADGITFMMGTQTVYVDSAQPWSGRDFEHDQSSNFSNNGAFNMKWDYESCTATSSTGLLITCTGLKLPVGTEVWFSTSNGSLPTGLVNFWSNRRKSYYVVTATPATSLTTTGSVKVSEAPGGAAIAYTDANGSGSIKLQFAGYRSVVTVDIPRGDPLQCDPATNICSIHDGAGTPVAHGFVTSGTQNSIRPFAGAGGVLPDPLVTWFAGKVTQYCIDPINTTTFYLRMLYTVDASCPDQPDAYYSTNPTGTATATVTSGNGYINMSVDYGGSSSYPDIPIRFTSVTSGSMGPEVALNTTYYLRSSSGGGTNPRLIQAYGGGDFVHPFTSSFTANVSLYREDFTSAGTQPYYNQHRAGSSHYVRDITGLPAGTKVDFRFSNQPFKESSQTSSTGGYGLIDIIEAKITIILKVPAIAAAGDYTVSVYYDESSSSTSPSWESASFTLKAVTLPTLTRTQLTSADFTAVPNLATWEDIMTKASSGGGSATGPVYARCAPPRDTYATASARMIALLANPGSMGTYEKNWNYDGAYGFAQVAAWQPTTMARLSDQADFVNCADYLADDTADEYRTGSHEAYNWFMRGIYESGGRGIGKARHQEAKKLWDMIKHVPDKAQGNNGSTDDFGQRTLAYALDRRIFSYLVTKKHNPDIKLGIDITIMWMYEKAMGSAIVSWDEPFMLGLSERSMTLYYRYIHPDPRIPVVMKMVADKFMADWYDPVTHTYLYNPHPVGEKCGISCEVNYNPSPLNGLLGGLLAWVWRYTGDVTYRDHYDEVIGNIFAESNPYDPKQYNQAYSYRGIEGMKWRQGLEDPLAAKY